MFDLLAGVTTTGELWERLGVLAALVYFMVHVLKFTLPSYLKKLTEQSERHKVEMKQVHESHRADINAIHERHEKRVAGIVADFRDDIRRDREARTSMWEMLSARSVFACPLIKDESPNNKP